MTAINNPLTLNSGSGSDTQASGVGPATALFGTGASLDGTAVVDLSADTPDLSGVSAGMLIWVDASTGRQWGVIASVNDGADTVTCDDAFTPTESGRNWGLGGKRASIDQTMLTDLGSKIVILEMESGYTQTISTELNVGGDTIVRGASGAATRPIITWSGTSGFCLDLTDIGGFLIDFDINVTGTGSSAAFRCFGQGTQAKGIRVYGSGSMGRGAIMSQSEAGICHCSFSGPTMTVEGIQLATFRQSVDHCLVDGTSGVGIDMGGNASAFVTHNIVRNCTGIGIDSNGGGNQQVISHNTCHDNGSDGIDFDAGNGSRCENNILKDNGGYGINLPTAANNYTTQGCWIDGNAFDNNTSGAFPSGKGEGDIPVIRNSDTTVDFDNASFDTDATPGDSSDLVDAAVPASIGAGSDEIATLMERGAVQKTAVQSGGGGGSVGVIGD